MTSAALRRLALLALIAGAQAAAAGQLSTVVNGKSYHIGSERDWNEANYGLGFEYAFDTRSRWKPVVMANGFLDSESNMSYMAGGGLHRTVIASDRLDGLHVDLGLNAFLMSRQDVDDGRPFPGLLPSLTIGTRTVGINLSYVPKSAVRDLSDERSMDRDIRGIVFLQLKFNVTELLREE